MFKFDALKVFKRGDKLPPKREATNDEQLLQIIGDIEQTPDLFNFLVGKLSEQSGEAPEEVKRWFKDTHDSKNALGLAKKVDEYLGVGTFRKLSFVSKGADAKKNVLRILSRDLKSNSYEGKAEKGLYLNIKENYGVEWNLEKTARDILQNFFDGNNQTLDGIDISVSPEKTSIGEKVTVKIHGNQQYDWRELVHLGGSTKTDSETTAGGFGEGTKILSLILLRDYGAKKVRFSSGDWELDFYIDKVPQGSYRNQEDRGLFVKKRMKKSEPGNTFELEFEDEEGIRKAQAIQEAKELFYNSENKDFEDPSFNDKTTGGFSILEKNPESYKVPMGNLYIAGQRMHFDSKEKWNTIDMVNIWTWKKVTPKDRDRGMITGEEMKSLVIPLIVEKMSLEEAKGCVRNFERWYTKLLFRYQPSYLLLEAIVDKLAKSGVKMEFKKDLLADNIPYSFSWISNLLKQQGYKMAPEFMHKIGMQTSIDQFKKLQEHSRVPETSQEKLKISLLQEAARLMDFPEEDRKEVWVFGAEDEKNIFHGQYNPDFFWLAREKLTESFFDALHTYIHEAAHKAGPHGDAKFEYTLQEYIKKIQLWMHNHRDDYERIEKEWTAS